MRAWIGSLLFSLGMIISVTVTATLLMALVVAPMHWRYALISAWGRMILGWLRLTCGVRYEITGLEKVPPGGAVVLAKHQSTWETFALQTFLPRPVWVVKRELLGVPFFGWGLLLMHAIPIDRGSGRVAMKQIIQRGKARLAQGHTVVLFPEGTRVAPGRKLRYRLGGAVLACSAGVPVVPVAHNAGEFWGRRVFLKRAGLVRMRIGDPIPSEGKSPEALIAEVEAWIEGQMEELTDPRWLGDPAKVSPAAGTPRD